MAAIEGDWDRDGFEIHRSLLEPAECAALEARINEIADEVANGADIAPSYFVYEKALQRDGAPLRETVSKLFRVHRTDPLFNAMCRRDEILGVVREKLPAQLACFLSQFIFKLPGALGQPWHQDAYYFPYDRRPQVGVWIAVTAATMDNGPLWVLPGSHTEPVHAAEPDTRPDAGPAYVEIVDHDMEGAVPVLMAPGDVLFFHSHLMHKSTDNASAGRRAAMVYHYGDRETVDLMFEKHGRRPPNVDWMDV